MMLIMPCIYVVSPKSSKNPEFFFYETLWLVWEVGGVGVRDSGEKLSHREMKAQEGQTRLG